MKLICEEILNPRQVFHMPQGFAKKISTKEKNLHERKNFFTDQLQ